MIIGVFGIPGIGKTTLCAQISILLPNVKVFSASQLIKLFDGEISYSKLTKDTITSNQYKLISVAQELKNDNSCNAYILELHNVIETTSGEVYIPKRVFEEIGIDRAIFLYKNPLEISNQRYLDPKERSIKDLKGLEMLQINSLTYFKKIFPPSQTKILCLSEFSINEASIILYKEIKSYFRM